MRKKWCNFILLSTISSTLFTITPPSYAESFHPILSVSATETWVKHHQFQQFISSDDDIYVQPINGAIELYYLGIASCIIKTKPV